MESMGDYEVLSGAAYLDIVTDLGHALHDGAKELIQESPTASVIMSTTGNWISSIVNNN